MSATLKVTHNVGFGIELRSGAFQIVVDGKTIGSVTNNETLEEPIEPGHHTLRIRKGRYGSREHSFEIGDAEVISFRCHGVRIWPMYLASIAMPNLGIALAASD